MPLPIILALDLAAGSGELRLTSTDSNVQPSLDYHYLDDPFDLQRLRDAVRLCLRLAEHADFEDILGEHVEPTDMDLESDTALEDWLMRKVSTTFHISGTCKMGPASDPMAVVDQYGIVHGIEGLRVVDASIMPNCVRANAERNSVLADFMLPCIQAKATEERSEWTRSFVRMLKAP